MRLSFLILIPVMMVNSPQVFGSNIKAIEVELEFKSDGDTSLMSSFMRSNVPISPLT
jgi:hypothetical protein